MSSHTIQVLVKVNHAYKRTHLSNGLWKDDIKNRLNFFWVWTETVWLHHMPKPWDFSFNPFALDRLN